jgi:hypothetical protein
MMEGKKRGLWIFLITLLILILAGGGVFTSQYFHPRPRISAPEITIISPESPTTVVAGEFLYIQTNAQAGAGITRVEMAADGAPYRYQEAQDGPAMVLPVDFTWRSEQTGPHTLTFTAIGADNNASPPATLEVTVTEAVAADGSVNAAPNDVKTWEGPEVVAALDTIGGGAAADGDGELAGIGAAEEMGGQDGADAGPAADGGPLPQDQRPSIQLLDASIREGGGLFIMVKMTAQDDIGVAAINASFIENGVLDTHIFDCEILQLCEHNLRYQLDAGERELAVYAIDTVGQISETALLEFQVVPGEQGRAPALVVDRDFDPNQIALVEDAVAEERRNQLDDFGGPRITGYQCSGNIVRIGVPYRYFSNNGHFVYAGGFAHIGGELMAGGWVPIENQSYGLVQFDMETTSNAIEGVTTESMTLQMMQEVGDAPFYSEQAQLQITWPQPKPDLVITDVQRSINGRDITVTVENRGCADADGFTLAAFQTGEHLLNQQIFAEPIPAGASREGKFRQVDPNSYARTFSVVVDPDNDIDEIDEGNNRFYKNQIQISYIHFYKIDIHDTSDGEWYENADEGEWRLYVAANGALEIRPTNSTNWVWKMGKGSHEINGLVRPIFIVPTLLPEEPLVIVVDLEEDDTFPPNDWDKAVVTHSFNLEDTDSWKLGHGQSRTLTSNKGRFTIHYWIVLDF